MNQFHRFPIFFAPDGDAASAPTQVADVGTPEISVPVIPATPRNVQEVTLPGNEALENAPILKDLPKETRKVRGPQDFGMPTAEESAEEMGLIPKRERDPATGKFVPKAPQSSPSTQQPKAKATVPPAAQKPTPTAQPVKTATPATQAPVAPAKVKIGGEEKTAAEWEAEIAALKAGKTAPIPPAEKPPVAPAKTAEETAAETAAQKERETKFLTERAKDYVTTPEDLDILLAGGPKAVEWHAMDRAKLEMRTRQFAADQVNKLAEHYDNLLAPILNQNQTVQSLMQETAFLGAHPDIKSNPKGLETFREMKATMESGRKAIADKITAGTATRREQLWAEEYDEATPESLMNDLAAHTRAKLATLTPAPATTPPAAKPPTPQVKPNPANVEKPLGGDRPGGNGSAPRGETAEQRIVREVNASRGIQV